MDFSISSLIVLESPLLKFCSPSSSSIVTFWGTTLFLLRMQDTPWNHLPCSGGGACVIPRSWELYWRKLWLLAGLTKPGRSKGRIQTNQWSNCWQQGEGSAHRQIQPGVFWLWVTVVLRRTLRLLVGVASINYQISNRKKIPKRFDQWVWVNECVLGNNDYQSVISTEDNYLEAATRDVLQKKLFLKISKNS